MHMNPHPLRRMMFAVALAAGTVLLLGGIAAAKVSVSQSSVPGDATAGEPFEVTFRIEDHDGAFKGVDTMKVVAEDLAGGEPLAFEALLDGDTFKAEVTLPTEGNWALLVVNEDLEFRQDLATVKVEANPAAAVTNGQFTASMQGMREQITKEVSATVDDRFAKMSAEIDTLSKQVGTLQAERDTLQKQVGNLETQLAQPPATEESGMSAWLAALIGAATALVTLAGAWAVLNHRLPRLRPVSAEAR
jgi:outer membrane murein-binding lipoprotein Lpp